MKKRMTPEDATRLIRALALASAAMSVLASRDGVGYFLSVRYVDRIVTLFCNFGSWGLGKGFQRDFADAYEKATGQDFYISYRGWREAYEEGLESRVMGALRRP